MYLFEGKGRFSSVEVQNHSVLMLICMQMCRSKSTNLNSLTFSLRKKYGLPICVVTVKQNLVNGISFCIYAFAGRVEWVSPVGGGLRSDLLHPAAHTLPSWEETLFTELQELQAHGESELPKSNTTK